MPSILAVYCMVSEGNKPKQKARDSSTKKSGRKATGWRIPSELRRRVRAAAELLDKAAEDWLIEILEEKTKPLVAARKQLLQEEKSKPVV